MQANKTGGFTLVELIISITLISLLIPVVMLAFRQGILKMDRPAKMTATAFIAQDKMEWFLQYDYSDANLDPAEGSDQVTVNQQVYDRDWSITYVEPGFFAFTDGDSGYKKIAVSAGTADFPQLLEIQTLVTRRE